MKHLLCFLLLLPFCVSAQCYGSFEVFGGYGISATPSGFESVDDRPVVVNNFGFGASIAVGRQTLLRTSMHFGQYGDRQWTGPNGFRWGSQSDGDGGFDPFALGEPDFDPDVLNRHLFIEGTIALRRVFPSFRSPWRPFVEGGLSVGGYGTSINKTEGQAAVSETINRFRSTAVIGRFGVGADYNFNDQIGMYAMPVVQYHLRSLNELGLTRVHPWRLTLEVGLRVFVDPR